MTLRAHTERLAAGLALAGMLATVLALLATPALGHAALQDSEPGDDDVVEGAPEEIVLTFNEPMQPPATLDVTGPDDDPVAEDQEVDIDGERVRLALEGLTDDGVYTVAWRAVSADDHPISGEFAFEVVDAAPADEPEPTPEPAEPPTGALTSEPTEPATPTPEAVTDAEPTAAEDSDGGAGLVVWLLGGAVLVAAVATGMAVRASRNQASA